jgi:hypothetical protein
MQILDDMQHASKFLCGQRFSDTRVRGLMRLCSQLRKMMSGWYKGTCDSQNRDKGQDEDFRAHYPVLIYICRDTARVSQTASEVD